MKKTVKVEEVEDEGLVALLDEPVCLFCLNYIYAGTLADVNDDDVLLVNARIVYETGSLGGSFKDAQALPGPWYVRTSAIESYGRWNA